MTDGDGHHVAGDIVASTAAIIGNALAGIPHTRLEISSEVVFEGEAFGFAIYPTGPGNDFLIGGNIWLSVDATRELVRAIGAALERAGVRYQFELAIDQKHDAVEVIQHPDLDSALR